MATKITKIITILMEIRGRLYQAEIIWISLTIRAWIENQINSKRSDAIINPLQNFNDNLAKPSLVKLWHGWVFISHREKYFCDYSHVFFRKLASQPIIFNKYLVRITTQYFWKFVRLKRSIIETSKTKRNKQKAKRNIKKNSSGLMQLFHLFINEMSCYSISHKMYTWLWYALLRCSRIISSV